MSSMREISEVIRDLSPDAAPEELLPVRQVTEVLERLLQHVDDYEEYDIPIGPWVEVIGDRLRELLL